MRQKPTLTSSLDLLATGGAYAQAVGPPVRRWGQLLRQHPVLGNWLLQQEEAGALVRLGKLGELRGGAVTRANAYFLVDELPFGEIPKRFRITRNDHARTAIVMDGLGTAHRIERRCLRPVIKGPEALLTPAEAVDGSARLFYVTESREVLRKARANGALDYLRRGETVAYKTSGDTLKGGIPAKRSQVKNRKPFWYSISVPEYSGARIVLPEHVDGRYIATLLSAGDERVVIDKLYTFEPSDPDTAALIHASLNSVLAWYQTELRGRTQLGQGVLELKKPDWNGVLVLNPKDVDPPTAKSLIMAFEKVASKVVDDSLDTASSNFRVPFDLFHLQAAGATGPEIIRLELERETRAAAGERLERRISVAEAKRGRRLATKQTMSIDAYAARIAGMLEPFPDPRAFVPDEAPTLTIRVAGPVEGDITIGQELFNQGRVLAADREVADALESLGAEFVRGALMADREASEVEVPAEPQLMSTIQAFRAASADWEKRFADAAAEVCRSITDPRLRAQISGSARLMLHAD